VAPLPYSNSGAQLAFDAALFAFVVLELRVRIASRRNHGGARSDRLSLVVVHASVVVAVLAGCLSAAAVEGAAISGLRWSVFCGGLALIVAGIVIRQWSVFLLGRFFTVDVRVHPGQTVVDSGPYRWVRHPSYTGMLVTFAGIGLALGNWVALAALIVLPLPGLVYRISVEERALLDGIGEPYRRFAAGRSRLVPGLW
jgi:protein-S-isoprenylcysteine O-methyltransferase Ste14